MPLKAIPNPLPDMRPIVGPFPGKPGLWLDVGHHHLGLTLGPITGRLLAEVMAGEASVRGSRPVQGGTVPGLTREEPALDAPENNRK